MSLMDQLMQAAAGQVTKQASQQTGLSEGMAEKLLPMAMAALMGGLKKNAATPAGAEALSNALDKHDGSLLSNPSKFGDNNLMDEGQKILGHILGNKQGITEQALAKAGGGISESQVNKVLAMAAPAILASLGKAKQEQGLDVSALAGLVTNEGTRAQENAGGQLNGLFQLLDADGDGDIKEEALGMGKKILGGLFKR